MDPEEQARRDEELLAAYLGEEVEEEKAFSSESEYGGSRMMSFSAHSRNDVMMMSYFMLHIVLMSYLVM